MHPTATKNRIEYFDWLRILATFTVILIHVCTPYWFSADTTSAAWQIMNLYESIGRWCAPVFFMISGVLFLGGNQTMGRILRKNVLHIVSIFVFWSALYIGICYGKGQYTVTEAIAEFFNGYYHMWYLHVQVGLYLAVPILRRIARSREVTVYFLILSFLFGILFPQTAIWAGFWKETLQKVIERIIGNLDISIVAGYSFYFLLGYYLHNTEFTKSQKKWIYGFGVAGVAATLLLTAALSVWQKTPVHCFYENLTPNVAFACAAVFLFAKEHFCYGSLPKRAVSFLQTLSKYSLGVYLMHPFFYDLMRYNLGIDPMAYPPLLSIPVCALVLYLISLVGTAILNHIPGLRKWIV